MAEARRARCSPPRIPVGFGIYLHTFTFPFIGRQDVPTWLGASVTVIGIVAVMNMVNFLDGLDGLAAGVCAISGLTFAVIELSLGRIGAAVLAAIVCGACLGFLRHNFYPARIFMGDSGAMLLGFTLATISVQGLLKTAALATLVLPLLVLAVPVLDTSFVVAKRLKQRAADLRRRRTPPAPPLHAARLHAAPRGRLPLDVVRDARARGARDPLRAAAPARPLEASRTSRSTRPPAWRRSAFSFYVVYLLEIVKLANRRPRRRDAASKAA